MHGHIMMHAAVYGAQTGTAVDDTYVNSLQFSLHQERKSAKSVFRMPYKMLTWWGERQFVSRAPFPAGDDTIDGKSHRPRLLHRASA